MIQNKTLSTRSNSIDLIGQSDLKYISAILLYLSSDWLISQQ